MCLVAYIYICKFAIYKAERRLDRELASPRLYGARPKFSTVVFLFDDWCENCKVPRTVCVHTSRSLFVASVRPKTISIFVHYCHAFGNSSNKILSQ